MSNEAGPFTLTLINRGRQTVEIGAGMNILRAVQAAGSPLVSGCTNGHCFTCAAQLLWGRVELPSSFR